MFSESPFEYCADTKPSVPTVTPVRLPNRAPSTVEPVNVEALSNCVMPFDEPTVPILTETVCALRPDAADQGTLTEIFPVAGPAVLALASVPSALKLIVPV